jgi:hypothetical protein
MLVRFTRPVNWLRSLRPGTPFREFTSADTATLGGYWASRWTWSASPLNSRRSGQTFRIAVSQQDSIAPSRTPCRYLVTKTKGA